MNDEIYDDYHEQFYTRKQVDDFYTAYLKWCAENKQVPEVETQEMIDVSNIGHVVYHALIWMEANGKLLSNEEVERRWTCPECKHKNSLYHWVCENCHFQIDEPTHKKYIESGETS